jgi:tape measure domain-containing protein
VAFFTSKGIKMAIAGTLEIQLLANVARLQNDLDKATRSVGGAMGNIEKSVNTAKNAFRGLVGGIGLVEILKVTDQYTKLNAQLNIASRTQADYTKSLQDVVRISNLAQTSLEGTATLYSRLANTLKDTNVTQQQFANITESVALGLRVSGASTAEAQSAMLQLSQAFASGVLRGEEFNAVSEASFPLMKALADSMGIPIEQLRSMAQEGKITRDELVKAFADPALIATFQNQAKELNTVGGAFQVLKNNLTLVIGEINQTTGASNQLAQALTGLASSAAIRVPFEALAVLGVNVAFVFRAIGTEIGGIAAQLVALGKLDFKGFANIREMMIADAKQARIEVDALSEAIVNPKSAQTANSLPAQAQQLNTALASAVTSTGKLSEAEKEYQRILQNRKDANAEILDLQNITGLLKQGLDIEEARFRVEAARKGLLPAQIEALLKENAIQADIAEAEKARQDRLQVWIKTQQKAYDDELKAIDDIEKARVKSNQKASDDYLKEVQRAEDERRREFERTSDIFTRSLTDSIFRGFEAGKSFAENFKDALINSFKTLVLQPVVKFLVDSSGIAQIFSSLSGALTGSGSGSFVDGVMQQRQGGIGGIFQSIGNIFSSTNQSIFSGIESVGASISNGLGGIRDTIGGFLGSNASLVANIASYGGAILQLAQGNWAGAAGTAIGTALGGPIGGAIGSFLGGAIGSLFGGKKIPMTGDQAKTRYNAGNITSSTNTFGKSSLGGKDALTQANEAFAKTYGALITQFDANAKFTIDTIYRSRTNTQGFFRFNGQSLQSGSQKGISFEGFIKKFMGEGLADVIRRSTAIPKAFRDLFIGLKKPEAVEQVVLNVIKLNENAAQLKSTLGITAEQVALLATESGIAGDNLTLLVNKVTGVSSQLFTIGEALVKVKAGIDGAFTSLSDSQLPANLKAFDEAIKALDKTTAQGRQDFLGLIQLREQFAQFEAAIGGLKSGVKGALFGIVSDAERQQIMNQDLAAMFAELNMTVPGSIQELIALGKSIDYTTAEGLNLASVFPTLVNAFNTTKGAVDSLINSLTSSRFETFADFAIGSSLARQGVGLNQIPVRGASQGSGDQVAVLLTRLIAEVSEMKQSTQQTADNTLRTTRELEDIAGGNVTLSTQAA